MAALGLVNDDRSIERKRNYKLRIRPQVIRFVLENTRIALVKPPVQKYIFCLLEERFENIVQELSEAETLLKSDLTTTTQARARLKALQVARQQLQGEMQEFTAASSLLSKIIRWFM